jgi:CRP-like cAMP-binding protein
MLEHVYVKSNFLRSKLAIMADFAIEARLDQGLLNKIRQALKYSNKKTCLSIKERDAILNELSTPLKYEIAVAMHGQAYSKIDFFRDKDKVIITGIVPYLHPVYVDQNEFVYTKSEHVDGIYFIIKGYAAYVFNKSNTRIRGIQCGDYFGDIEAIQHITRKYTVRALRNTDLLSMDTNILQQFAQNYLDEWEKLRCIAQERDNVLMKTIAEMKETTKLESISDLRRFKINVETRILRKKTSLMEKEKKLSRKDVSLFKLNRKMESMCTRLFNLQSNIKCVKKEFSRPLKRKTTFPIRTRNIIHETQDSMPDENSPNFDIVKSVTSLDNNY